LPGQAFLAFGLIRSTAFEAVFNAFYFLKQLGTEILQGTNRRCLGLPSGVGLSPLAHTASCACWPGIREPRTGATRREATSLCGFEKKACSRARISISPGRREGNARVRGVEGLGSPRYPTIDQIDDHGRSAELMKKNRARRSLRKRRSALTIEVHLEPDRSST